MRTTNSVVVARTDEMKMSSGRERKREAVSKSPIDETLLATWQRHNSSIGVYQRITEMSKQAGSLILRMSLHYIVKNTNLSYPGLEWVFIPGSPVQETTTSFR